MVSKKTGKKGKRIRRKEKERKEKKKKLLVEVGLGVSDDSKLWSCTCAGFFVTLINKRAYISRFCGGHTMMSC